MKKLLFLGLSLIVISTACNKSDSDNKTPAEYLTSGNWYIRAANTHITGPGVDSTSDDFANMDACEKDNSIKFNSDGTAITDEGATKCNSTDPQTTSGTWALIDNNTKLVTKDNSSSSYDTLNVSELNGSTLKFVTSYNFLLFSYSTTVTLGH